MALPRILIVDHFDSYTLNLLSLLQGYGPDRIVVLPHTHPLLHPDAFHKLVRPHIDAIILSPGPGSPHIQADFAAAEKLLKDTWLRLPVLGVCLGHQGLATAFGGRVQRAVSVRHGLLSKLKIVSETSSLLQGIPQDAAVIRYNSLVVDADTLPACLEVTAWSHDEVSTAPPPYTPRTSKAEVCTNRSSASTPFASSQSSPVLASTTSQASSVSDDHSSSCGHSAIMALQHKTLPYHSVQFHPESIESTYGHRLMNNFLDIVRQYWIQASSSDDHSISADAAHRQSAWRDPHLSLPPHIMQAGEQCLAASIPPSEQTVAAHRYRVVQRRFPALGSESLLPIVFDRIFRNASTVGAVWLDSAREKDPHSRYSYMAVPSFALSYKKSLTISVGNDISQTQPLPESTPSFWEYMKQLHYQIQTATDRATHTDGNLFLTGFIGYWGYEMMHQSLGLDQPSSINIDSGFDAEFFFCNHVLAFDHRCNEWIASVLVAEPDTRLNGLLGSLSNTLCKLQAEQSVSSLGQAEQSVSSQIGQTVDEAAAWLDTLEVQINNLSQVAPPVSSGLDALELPLLRARMSAEQYMDQIEAARELIAAGETYELCLTNQFRGVLSTPSDEQKEELDHFALYCQLRARNPAPYSAYLRLPSAAGPQSKRARAILSTSPERFVSITSDGKVEMKPIKGTLARAGYGPGEDAMRSGSASYQDEQLKQQWRHAEDKRRRAALSADVKERAENLMIVDLIRADLYSFCQTNSVSVPELMQVESYQTVHQLVTTVVGQLKDNVSTVEALRRCFPPGSMTGAPKRRSVQLLQKLENAPRGIYSGALGWMGVDGAADFSVVIRTLVANGDAISIGAGGAITYLSDPQKEWQEVLDKVNALALVDAS